MRVRILLRYEDGGRPIAQWRHGFQGRDGWDAEGVLSLVGERVKELNDFVKVARLRSLDSGEELLLPLYRAEMLVEGKRVRVIGIEQDIYRKFTAQTWAGVLMQDQGEEEEQP